MSEAEELQKLADKEYEFGFVTDVESDSLPPGLDEDTIRAFVSSLDIPDEAKAQLMALTPQTYLGNATDQAKAVDR